jgi:Ca-activated chloride channel homolog
MDRMKKARNKRKALLILSEGGDNHSRYTRKQIWSVVSEADVRAFALGTTELAESSWK